MMNSIHAVPRAHWISAKAKAISAFPHLASLDRPHPYSAKTLARNACQLSGEKVGYTISEMDALAKVAEGRPIAD